MPFNLSDNLFNYTNPGSAYIWGMDYLLALLLIIAFCQLFQVVFTFYRWWRLRRHDIS